MTADKGARTIQTPHYVSKERRKITMTRFSHSTIMFTVVAHFVSNACAAPPIAYPDALAAAAVSESTISDIRDQGLVTGNGEMNAIVYSTGNDLHLRINKNDCWDMRVDTQDDPPLPVVDVAAGTATHGISSFATTSGQTYLLKPTD